MERRRVRSGMPAAPFIRGHPPRPLHGEGPRANRARSELARGPPPSGIPREPAGRDRGGSGSALGRLVARGESRRRTNHEREGNCLALGIAGGAALDARTRRQGGGAYRRHACLQGVRLLEDPGPDSRLPSHVRRTLNGLALPLSDPRPARIGTRRRPGLSVRAKRTVCRGQRPGTGGAPRRVPARRDRVPQHPSRQPAGD